MTQVIIIGGLILIIIVLLYMIKIKNIKIGELSYENVEMMIKLNTPKRKK